MGTFVVRIVGAVGAAALSVAMVGSGIASADALAGNTYADAAAKISSWKGTPVIATVSGDQLATDDCIVTSWHKSKFLDSAGRNDRPQEYLLTLNCNNSVASPGNPGNSAMSKEGAAAKRAQEKDQQMVAAINKNPPWCHKSKDNLANCQKVCERTGACEV